MSCQVVSASVVVCCTIYAILRYVIVGDVSPEQLPTYIVNKGVSFGGLILLGWSRCSKDPGWRRDLGMAGFVLIAVHVLLSLMILNPAYFPKFFHSSGLMTWQAELSMLAGALSLLALVWLYVSSTSSQHSGAQRPGSLRRFLGRSVLALALVHLAMMGYQGWLTPGKWQGNLPPISLLSSVAAVVTIAWPRNDQPG